jgi:RecA/RadA recombinase
VDNERQQKLLASMKKFNQKNKAEIFTLGNEIEEIGVIQTGIESIDKFMTGFKKGGHTIIYGAYSVGKTALILMAIANAQKQGFTVCYINTEKPIDPERFRFFGINMDTFVYIEAPENAEIALEALRTLSKDKVIDLFVIDSTNGLCPKSVQEDNKGNERALEKNNVAALPKALSEFYNAVNAHVFRARAAVVWVGQMRTKGIGSYVVRNGLTGGNAQNFFAYQIVAMKRGERTNNPVNKVKHYFLEGDKLRYKTEDEECGFSVILKLEKTNSSKSAKENSSIEIPYLYSKGFANNFVPEETFVIDGCDEDKEIITKMLVEKGIIKDEVIKKESDIIEAEGEADDEMAKMKVLEEPKKRGRKAKEQK